jgi:16S rRNA pseudouridine516 synthase
MQLERLLHAQGFGSRKECRGLIRAGHVSVAGIPCDNPYADFDPASTDGSAGIEFSVGDEVWQYRAKAYLMLHKPTGYECSHKPTFHPSVFTLMPPQMLLRDVQCIGRLDQDTTGLLLLSDDGQFIHQWSSGKKRTPKLYEVSLKHEVGEDFVARLLAGVELHDEPAPIAASACSLVNETTLHLTICEGKYHQVKRMIAAAGNRVEALHRSQVGGLALDPALAPGQWRWLEAADIEQLANFN